jgi:acyl carrier protein
MSHEIIVSCPLRFIRSSGASLPPRVFVELQGVFNAPVINRYGLTETCSHVTCDPLPPRERKMGSVGVAAGSEVAIMDELGTILPACETGEVVIRGPSIFHGYDNNPMANASAFTHGWFRTGDQGYLDVDGYLFITGRLKEIINRGGEKISPYEVEEVLMEHPAVAEIFAFPMPHAQLGEEVAAAIVLREDASATAREIRAFVASRLADFKVPSQVVFLSEIPKGATGKVQRFDLAVKLGLAVNGQSQSTMHAGYTAPRTLIEAKLAVIWAQVLGLKRVGINDDFFELGGHSLLATQVMARLHEAFRVELPLRSLFEAPTVAALAEQIEIVRWTLQDLRAPCGDTIDDHEEGEL